MVRRGLLPVVVVLAVGALTACGSVAPTPQEESPTPTPDSTPTIEEAPASDLNAILATTVLRTGPQRVAFILISPKALVTTPEATVSSVYLPGGDAPPEAGQVSTASFHLWPYGTRGSYTAELSFDRPGTWMLDISVPEETGLVGNAQLLLDVQESIGIVDIGQSAPASKNKTLGGVGGLAELTSDSTPDPTLYITTIADAVADEMPLMLVFATPALCTSPTCGPQVDTVQEVGERYRGQAHFIHVEVYDNPAEIQGDLSRARLSPIVHEWGLSTVPHWFNESWVFVVDPQGKVTAKFEGFATAEELEEALLAVLK